MPETVSVKVPSVVMKNVTLPATAHNVLRAKEMGVAATTGRNGGYGVLLGSALLIWRFRKWNTARRKIKYSSSVEELEKLDISEQEKNIQKARLLRAIEFVETFKKRWWKDLLVYPAHLVTGTFVFKTLQFLGRLISPVTQTGVLGLEKTGRRRVGRRGMLALGAFISGFAAELAFPAWNWSLLTYAFCRAVFSFTRLNPAVSGIQVKYVYAVIHAFLPFFITFTCRWIQKSYYMFFQTMAGADINVYIGTYDPKKWLSVKQPQNQRGGVIASLKKLWHHLKESSKLELRPCSGCAGKKPETGYHRYQHMEESCAKAFVKDFFDILRKCFKFYSQFYGLIFLFGGRSSFRRLTRKPKAEIIAFFTRALRSALFMAVGFHFAERFHCIWRWLHKPGEKVYNNIPLFLLHSGFWGFVAIQFEPVPRRSDLALFAFSKQFDQLFRFASDTQYDEPERGFLKSRYFTSSLFAMSCAFWSFAYFTNPKSLKGPDKWLIENVLA